MSNVSHHLMGYGSEDDDHWSFISDDHHQQDDDDDDEELDQIDPEITVHHRESSPLKHTDWLKIPSFLYAMDPSTTNDENGLAQVYTHQYTLLNIRRRLEDDGDVLLPTYQGIDYHVYPLHDFRTKVKCLLAQSDTFTFIRQLDLSSAAGAQNQLGTTVRTVETTLKRLYEAKSITYRQLLHLEVNRSIVRLPYLCFAVDIETTDKELRPIMICTDGPTQRIAHYLGHLLNQLFNQATSARLFDQTTDVLEALKHYKEIGRLTERTLLASFNIHHLSRHFSHERILTALETFLNAYGSEETMQGLSVKTIVELVQLVLNQQYFLYNDKLYQQIAGGASGSSLTTPLVYIALLYEQADLFRSLLGQGELLGRFRDEAFITWNRTEQELRELLSPGVTSSALTWDLINIDTIVSFRDIVLSNSSGTWVTLYAHKFFIDGERLPTYLDCLQPCVHSSTAWLRQEFLKAIRYSSHPSLFYFALKLIRTTFYYHDGSQAVFNQAFCELLDKFSTVECKSKSDMRHLHNLQMHVAAFDQRRRAKKERRASDESSDDDTGHELTLPFTSIWNRESILDFETRLNQFIQKHLRKPSSNKELFIHVRPNRTSWTLLINDLLIKKRPDQRYLYLSHRQKTRPNLSDTIHSMATTTADPMVRHE